MLPGYTGVLMFTLVFVAYSVSSLHARLQGETLETFEKSLLQLFGLKSRPHAGKKAALPQYMLDLYRERRRAEDSFGMLVRGTGTLPANTVRSFYHSHQNAIDEDSTEHLLERFVFNVTALPTDEELTSAELRLFREGCHDCGRPSVRIEIHEIVRPASDTTDTISRLIDVRKVDATQTAWETFDVFSAVSRWKDTPHMNHGIEVRAVVLPGQSQREDVSSDAEKSTNTRKFSINGDSDSSTPRSVTRNSRSLNRNQRKSTKRHSGNLSRETLMRLFSSRKDAKKRRSRRSVDGTLNRDTGDRALSDSVRHHVRLRRSTVADHNWHSQRPLLVTYSDDEERSRQKRATRSNRRRGRAWRRKVRKLQCRRHTLYVDFNHVGWNDWIIAPQGYYAYYCHGNCGMPLANYLNTTNHAIVQNIMNSVDPAAVPRACCVPTDLSPISMLYRDQFGDYILKSYQNMVVQGCGCR